MTLSSFLYLFRNIYGNASISKMLQYYPNRKSFTLSDPCFPIMQKSVIKHFTLQFGTYGKIVSLEFISDFFEILVFIFKILPGYTQPTYRVLHILTFWHV